MRLAVVPAHRRVLNAPRVFRCGGGSTTGGVAAGGRGGCGLCAQPPFVFGAFGAFGRAAAAEGAYEAWDANLVYEDYVVF